MSQRGMCFRRWLGLANIYSFHWSKMPVQWSDFSRRVARFNLCFKKISTAVILRKDLRQQEQKQEKTVVR